MPTSFHINMADNPREESQRRFVTNVLLQFPPGSQKEAAFLTECTSWLRLKQYLKVPRRMGTFITANPRELRYIADDGTEHPFHEEEYQAIESILPYLNHQQNQYGPRCKGQVDITQATRESFVTFMGDYPGELIAYDEELAWTNYRRNGRRDEEMEQHHHSTESTPSSGNGQGNDEQGEEDKNARRLKNDMFNMYFKIKRPLSEYTMRLEKDDQFPAYNRLLITTAKAHWVYFILDQSKDPMEVCLHEAVYANAQSHMYLVFSETLKTPKGIEIVKDNVDDARAVYVALLPTTRASPHMPRCPHRNSTMPSWISVFPPRTRELWQLLSTSHYSGIISNLTTSMWMTTRE